MRKHMYAGVWTAALAVLAAGLGVAQAAAQFVCVGNATGTAVLPGTADGGGANASGSANNVACGTNANASGVPTSTGFASSNTAIGSGANASGSNNAGNTATGRNANASGDNGNNTATGDFANASGEGANNTAIGSGSTATGKNSDNTAIGNAADAKGIGSRNVAIGDDAIARGDGSARTAIGAGARAEGANSSAIGAGAIATRDNQMAFGTKDSTYTMGGITSAASKAAQTGPVELVTTDAFGNLASDGGATQRQIDSLGQRDRELADGIAISLALAQPFFHRDQTFAMNVGWGNFEGSNAFGVTAAGILSRGALGTNSTVTLHGGVGVGTEQGTVAGRAGLSFGW